MEISNDIEHIYDVDLFNISDLDVLLHESLKHTREILNAEAGTIYIKEKDYLKFHVFQNDTLSYEKIFINYHSVKDLKLPIDEKNKYLAVDAFLTRKIIMIDDVYLSTAYDFIGTKEYDKKFEYKTVSILTVPLIHPISDECVGVIQLLNKIIEDKILPFDLKDKEIISMLGSFMAISIAKAQEDVLKLREANEKLKEVNKNLEKRVKEEVSLNQEKSAIIFHQSKMASMGEMLSNLAHQWRQPLSTISTIASGLSLEFQLEEISKDNVVEKLGRIVSTTQSLSQTIDDFKGFYNIDTIQEDFSLKSVVDKSLELAEVVFSDNKISVVCNIDETIKVYGLKNEFTQAFLNILIAIKDNLLKETTSNSRYIFIDIHKESDKKILRIRDNSTHMVNFDNVKNFNMGLYMTKLIIQNHFKGDINYEHMEYTYKNENLKGGEYTITLA